MSDELNRLHQAATRKMHRQTGWYERKKVAWAAYHTFADALAARLPFRWHAVACDNPTQNHTGTTNGADHIVVDEALAIGCIVRQPGDALCRPVSRAWGANLWGESNGPTCKRCLEIAERIIQNQ